MHRCTALGNAPLNSQNSACAPGTPPRFKMTADDPVPYGEFWSMDKQNHAYPSGKPSTTAATCPGRLFHEQECARKQAGSCRTQCLRPKKKPPIFIGGFHCALPAQHSDA